MHPDDVDWFVTLDETHHELSTVGNKGGSTTTCYANSSFPRSGDRVVESASHITGVYAFTPRGECLPPLYILSTRSENEDNYKIDPKVCVGLPHVTAKYAQEEESVHASRIAVRKKGSMDTKLWHDLHRSVYAPCYKGKLSPETIRDPITRKLIKGPLIVKTDNGPGRLSKEAESIEFCEEMAKLGVFILLGLPNATEAQAELDQMYSVFQPRCKASAVRVVGKKMADRLKARELYAEAINSDGGSDSDGESSEDEKHSQKKGSSICNVSLSNRDLGNIVNGFPGDPIENRPFDYCFTQEKIIKSWVAVGFMPMTGNAANDPKVRYELGDGGAPQEALTRMNKLVEDYSTSATTLTRQGYNGGVLDLKPRVVVENTVLADNEAQVDHIVKNKLITSAGGLYKAGIVIANCDVVIDASKRSAVEAEELKEKAVQKKIEKQESIQAEAKMAFAAWVGHGRKVNDDGYPALNKKDAYAIVRVLLPRIDVKKEFRLGQFKTVKDCIMWLGQIGRGTTWDEEMAAWERECEESGDLPVARLF